MYETSQSPKISIKFYCQIFKKVIVIEFCNFKNFSLIYYELSLYSFENDERQDIIKRLWKDINHRRQQLSDIEQSLPKPNGTYLKIILGNVNVSILNKEDKYVYFN